MLKTSSPFSLILFGASGHLAKLKLYPALYVLALKKRLPEQYAVLGFARSEMDEESFKKLVEESIHANIPEVNTNILQEFLTHCSYHRGQYDSPQAFEALSQKLLSIEKHWQSPIRLAYLSVPPEVFSSVLQNLCKGKVHDHTHEGGFRCIVEKPVGHDLKSFEEVKKALTCCFAQEEIYLLDHYLGKEAVRNIYYLRLANPVLERILKNTLIHHVEITASEDTGLEGRAGYFEQVGTFRDMFQSHLLMILSLLTMRLRENEDSFRESRRSALEHIYLPPVPNLNDVILQGQYTAGTSSGNPPSYCEEAGAKASRTNTFTAMKVLTRTPRWEGVPVYLRSGKRLQKKETRISIQFQESQCLGRGTTPNRLDIILQGEAGMRLHLQTKLGGTEPQFRPLILEDPLVCIGDCLPEHGLLLLEAIHGKQQWYLSFEEIQTAWRLIDPLEAHLEKKKTPLYPYPAGSTGPKEAEGWIGRDGIQWF